MRAVNPLENYRSHVFLTQNPKVEARLFQDTSCFFVGSFF